MSGAAHDAVLRERFAAAERWLSAGETARAIPEFRAFYQIWPGHFLPPLRLAEGLLATGQAQEAIREARRAMTRAPDQIAPRSVYAKALLAAGQPERACEALAAAIQLAPRDASLRYQLGHARRRTGRQRDAQAAFTRALRLQPGMPDALIEIARGLRLTYRDEAALKLLTDAAARNPAHHGLCNEQARCLLDMSRPQEALAVLAEFPGTLNDAQVRTQAEALLACGDTDAAAAILTDLSDDPHSLADCRARWQLARTAVPNEIDERADRAFRASLTDHDASITSRLATQFQLARLWLDRKDGEKAFAALHHGHNLLRDLEPFERASHSAFIDHAMTMFNADNISLWQADNRDPAPIFIVGMPRSGTTLCEQILASHHRVYGAGERSAIGELARTISYARTLPVLLKGDDGATSNMVNEAARGFLDSLHALAPQAARIVDKMPGNYLYAGLIALLFPAAKIIYCARDPRDIGFSIYTRRFHAAHAYAHDLSDLGWYIAQHVKLMSHWQGCFGARIYKIHLPEWIHNFDRTLARLLDFLDLEFDPSCIRFFETERPILTASQNQVRRPINADGINRWRDYGFYMQPLIESLIAESALPSINSL